MLMAFAGYKAAVQREVPNHSRVRKDKTTLWYLIKVIIDTLLMTKTHLYCRCFTGWG